MEALPCSLKIRPHGHYQEKKWQATSGKSCVFLLFKLFQPRWSDGVEPCGFAPGAPPLSKRPQQLQRTHLLAEIALVERGTEDSFVHALQLGKSELPREQPEPGGILLNFFLQTLECVLHD